jgi:hypothetical protein
MSGPLATVHALIRAAAVQRVTDQERRHQATLAALEEATLMRDQDRNIEPAPPEPKAGA